MRSAAAAGVCGRYAAARGRRIRCAAGGRRARGGSGWPRPRARTRAEEFIETELGVEEGQLEENLEEEEGALEEKVRRLDALYEATFGDDIRRAAASDAAVRAADVLEFSRQRREEWDALVAGVVARVGNSGWTRFQREAAQLKLEIDGMRRERTTREWEWAEARREAAPADDDGGAPTSSGRRFASRIVLITGFESFNVGLYREVAEDLRRDGIDLKVFSDRDIVLDLRGGEGVDPRLRDVERALAEADAFFGSLLFDYDQVCWLKERLERVPLRVSFESAIELMESTRLGSFEMANGGKQKGGPPPVVKKLLAKFGSGREEDKLVGYLSFLKIGPKLLRFVPGRKVRLTLTHSLPPTPTHSLTHSLDRSDNRPPT